MSKILQIQRKYKTTPECLNARMPECLSARVPASWVQIPEYLLRIPELLNACECLNAWMPECMNA